LKAFLTPVRAAHSRRKERKGKKSSTDIKSDSFSKISPGDIEIFQCQDNHAD
jgi:hypothetical protein